MSQGIPSFWNSSYFVLEPDNWHLTEDAPEEVGKEFEKCMKDESEESFLYNSKCRVQ